MKSLCASIGVFMMVLFLVPSPCLSNMDSGLIRVPDDAFAEKEKPRPEGDLKREVEQLEEALKTYTVARDFKNQGLTYLSLGRVYEGLLDFDKVGECYQKALRALAKMGDATGEAQALSKLGWLKWKFGYYDEAEEFYERTVEAAKKVEDAREEAWAFYALGRLNDQQYAERDERTRIYEKALAIFTRIGDIAGQARTMYRLGGVCWDNPEHTNGRMKLTWYEKALDASRKIGDRKLEIEALDELGRLHDRWGHFDKAVEWYANAVVVRKQIGDPATGLSMSDLRDLYVKLGQPDRALALYVTNVERARGRGDAKKEAEALGGLGYFYEKQNQYDSALTCYEKALAIYTELGDLDRQAATMTNLSEVSVKHGQDDKALVYHKKALETARNAGDMERERRILTELAQSYSERGQPDKASAPHQESLAAARGTGDKRGEGLALHALGCIYYQQAQYDKALDCYDKALALWTSISDSEREARTLLDLGRLHDDAKPEQRLKAMTFYEKAVAVARSNCHAELEAKALERLGYAHKWQRQCGRAEECYRKALAIRIGLGGSGATSTRFGLADVYLMCGRTKPLVTHMAALAMARKAGDQKAEAQALTDIGCVYFKRGKHDKAVDHLKRALAKWSQLKDIRGQATCYYHLGWAFNVFSGKDECEQNFEKALSLARAINDFELKKEVSGGFWELGFQHARKGRLAQSIRAYEKAREIAHELEPRSGLEAFALVEIGRRYNEMGQYQRALEYYKESLSTKPDNEQALEAIAHVYLSLGEYDNASEFGERFLAVARGFRIDSPWKEADALKDLGVVREAQGKYSKALDCYERSLAIYEKSSASDGKGLTLNNLGRFYKGWGYYEKAMEYYERALQVFRSRGETTNEAAGLQNLGDVYQSWGQYEKAVACYDRTLAIRRKAGNPTEEAATLMIMGQALQSRGDYAQALRNFQQGLVVYSRAKLRTDWPNDLIGNLYLDRGDFSKAEPYIRKARYHKSLGRMSLNKSQYGQAKKSYEKVLKVAEKDKNADNLFTAYTGLGLSYEGLKDDKAAEEHFRKAVQLVEDLRSRVTPENRERFLDVKVNGFYRTTPYEGLSRVLIRQNKTLDAWKTSEYTKARVFGESMSTRAGKQALDLPKDVLQLDEELNNELAALKRARQTAYEKEDKEALASLDPKVKAMEEKFQKHVKMLRDKYPVFAASKYPEPMDLSQTALKDGEWALSYDVTDLGLIVYLTQGKKLQQAVLKPVTRRELDSLVQRFREPLDIKPGEDEDVAAKISKFDFVSGKKLADILLADILPAVPKDAPLIIVPADYLGVLPFEMLPLNSGGKIVNKAGVPNITGAEFFGDRNPISYYQSVTALTLARNFGKLKGSGNKLLVMCDPVFSPDDPRAKLVAKNEKQELLSRLTNDVLMSAKTQNKVTWPRMQLTAKLGKDLQSVYPGVTDVFEGLQATKATFKRQDLTKYQAIVFGTHGYAGTDLGGLKEPVLVLTLINQPEGQDGFLRQSEVMGLKMTADVVALTACQSGLGKRISGEGTMGMGRAFQYAGAKSVLMSLWSVAQNSSVQLTDSFFRHLKEGKSKLEALKLAREEIRKSGYDHPFFWAPFILVGEVR